MLYEKIFISHSSKDKQFARWISVDLANSGHKPWLDEWDIKAGESIPKKIGEGLRECDFIIVVLSESSVTSNWVEVEWQSKYWEEVQSGRVSVIPVLIADCEVPHLLMHKKYADFRYSYSDGYNDILLSIG
ncbi:toll/interleukin-1 receptor domain-containing protein [Pseudomonas solani]|uniref:toll/interleukin-1 receptor domain-containing protein n=1 Tax=Pseudomonas solani TaxID=2731552 RepID=UPI003C2F05EA